jgi:branched-chain amino acid transport system permease protein
MTQKMNKFNSLKKTTKVDFATYLGVIVVFIITTVLQNNGSLKRSAIGLLVPICCYMSMAVSLNLTVGILGELSLGHAGFMSVGAFSGIVASQSLMGAIPNAPVRLAISMVVGAIFAAIVGLLIGTPVLRLQGDYLAIVTLAFGEIIKELINCLIIGCDENGLHFIFNPAGNKTVDDLGLSASGTAIIKGAQGATATIATFTAGFILVMITLIVVLNLTRSRAGRAIMAIRDNRIAAQAIGLNLTKYKLMAFVTSAALAGAAGALYGLNYSSLQATKFNFNLSILVLVFVVLGGLGNIWGSLVAAAALTILPEALRQFADFRMLIYAIVLIFVMLATNNPQAKAFFQRLLPHRRASAEKED